LPRIRGTQIGLLHPEVVDQIKADMLAGQFGYEELRARVAGERDPKGAYHVRIGHHRMVAAMEIYRETGDPSAVRLLLQWGKWDDVPRTPIDTRPLPARDWWGAFRNWVGY
jgi:hypothetical protein